MKKLLFAACAVLSLSALQARYVEIDNDTDGREATTIKATIHFANGQNQTIHVGPDQEQKVYLRGVPAKAVTVRGVSGAAAGQQANFMIPAGFHGRRIKIDADVENGMLELSRD